MVIVLQILTVLFFIVLFIFLSLKTKSRKEFTLLPGNYKEILNDYVRFYRELNETDKKHFEERVEHFLSSVKITGVNAVAEDIDVLLIAAGAIIPVFSIRDWQYINLHEILLYPGSFNEDFDQGGKDRNISGMVGTGPMQHMMVINKWQLRQGFINSHDTHNTAIHEFVHLIDKMDGTIDGVPEIILERKYVPQWKHLMETTIHEMKKSGSDIDIYGATSPTEFFAVISEYFFEQPFSLKQNHPEVFEMLKKIYRTDLQ